MYCREVQAASVNAGRADDKTSQGIFPMLRSFMICGASTSATASPAQRQLLTNATGRDAETADIFQVHGACTCTGALRSVSFLQLSVTVH